MLPAGLEGDAVEADGKNGWHATSAAAASHSVDRCMSIFWTPANHPGSDDS
jgi:hypothetical protein